MPNPENLKHRYSSSQSREEASKNGRKGGIASGESKRAKAVAAELLELMPEMSDKTLESLKKFGVKKGAKLTARKLMIIAAIQKGMSGDYKAMESVLKIAGETDGSQPHDGSDNGLVNALNNATAEAWNDEEADV